MGKITKYSGKLKLTSALTGLVVLGLCVLGESFNEFNIANPYDGYYIVSLNGEVLGATKNPEETEDIIKEARYKIMCESEDMVYIEPEFTVKAQDQKVESVDEVQLEAKVYDILKSAQLSVENQQEAYILNIDGYTRVLATKDEVLDVLTQVKNQYDKKDAFQVELVETDEEHFTTWRVKLNALDEDEDAKIRAMSFVEDMEVIESYVDSSTVTSVEEVVADITEMKPTETIYEVEDGDCLSTIANDHDMYLSELLDINPYITEDSTLYIGDELTVTVPKPELSVSVTKRSTKKEYYSAEIEYIEDDSLYQGETEVVSKGKKGYRNVTYDTEYVDGVAVSKTIVDEEIVKKAVAKVVKTGTAIKPTYIRPISGGTTTSYFGYRSSLGDNHLGQDWAIPTGTAIYASCGGTVVSSGWNGSYGYSVLIKHPDGVQTRYAHMSSLLVSAGETVSQGQKIGLSGSTGNSTGPHLHFEVIVNGSVVDPLGYVSEY